METTGLQSLRHTWLFTQNNVLILGLPAQKQSLAHRTQVPMGSEPGHWVEATPPQGHADRQHHSQEAQASLKQDISAENQGLP